MSQPDPTAARLDAAATIRAYGGNLADLERAAYQFVASRIRESGERVTVELGIMHLADFVESLAIQLEPECLCACCGDTSEGASDLCRGCRGAGCTIISAVDRTPGNECPLARIILASRS